MPISVRPSIGRTEGRTATGNWEAGWVGQAGSQGSALHTAIWQTQIIGFSASVLEMRQTV